MQVVVLSSTRWRSPWLSKQHLARAFSQLGDDVLYVDPPVSAASPLRQRDRLTDLMSRTGRFDGVEAWTPLAVPGQNTAAGQALNASAIGFGIRRRVGTPDVVLAFGLESRGTLRRVGGRRIYHCTDSWSDHPGNDRARAVRWEAQLTAAADVVTACSRPLVDLLAQRGVTAHYVPHGVDASSFAGALPDPEIAGLPGPRIGYAGGINFRLSPDHLEAAIDSVPGGTLVLIGASWASARGAAHSKLDRLLRRPDVVAVGHRGGRSFAAALAALDVGLVPYEPTPFNLRSFPLKVLQYLASGLPVVTTSNGAALEHDDLVAMHDEPSSFGTAVRTLAVDDGRADERRAAAAKRPWTCVAGELRSLATTDDAAPL